MENNQGYVPRNYNNYNNYQRPNRKYANYGKTIIKRDIRKK